MPLSLPAPIAAYLAADQAKDADAVAALFAADGLVHDEKHDHRGTDQIRAWNRAAHAKYQYNVEPLAFERTGNTNKLRARLVGNFPGSPVEVTFTFEIAHGLITSLAIR